MRAGIKGFRVTRYAIVWKCGVGLPGLHTRCASADTCAQGFRVSGFPGRFQTEFSERFQFVGRGVCREGCL
jgi:hypothetical protein